MAVKHKRVLSPRLTNWCVSMFKLRTIKNDRIALRIVLLAFNDNIPKLISKDVPMFLLSLWGKQTAFLISWMDVQRKSEGIINLATHRISSRTNPYLGNLSFAHFLTRGVIQPRCIPQTWVEWTFLRLRIGPIVMFWRISNNSEKTPTASGGRTRTIDSKLAD